MIDLHLHGQAHPHPVEALDLLLLVLALLAEGQQLILQVADLLLQLGGLGVEALFLPLRRSQPARQRRKTITAFCRDSGTALRELENLYFEMPLRHRDAKRSGQKIPFKFPAVSS